MSDVYMTYEDWLRGCVHHDGRHGYVTLPCDEVLKIADFIERLRANRKTEPTISKMEQVDEPKTQMKTQNSNLTFETLEYCDICDHKGCEECIANALDEHCIPSQFKKQIEDECAKEYEELGLKELKELIEADRKTENGSEIPNNCDTCKHNKLEWYSEVCDGCSKAHSNYEPKDEPQTDCPWR